MTSKFETQKQSGDPYSFDQDFDQEKVVGHGHGEREGSSFGAYFNIVCVIAGTGTLQLPYSFGQCGWIGILLILLAGAIAIFTGNLLIKCLYYKDGERLSSYPEIGLASLGPIGKYVIMVLHYSISLGGSCVYISIAGTGTGPLVRNLGPDIPDVLWVIIAAVLVCLPFVLVKSMKEVALLAAFGAVSTLVLVVVVVAVGLVDFPNQIDNTHQVVVWSQVPVAMGSICFSFGGNVVYPHVESAMKNPQSWAKVLFLAIASIVVMYLMIAIVGYHVYGESSESPIYDSLPSNPATTVAILMLVAHVILAAPIMLTAFALEVEEAFNINVETMGKSREFLVRALLRSGTVVAITVPAIFLPVKLLMSLVGSLSNSLIIFVFPIVCYWRLFGIRAMNWPSLIFSGICIVVGIVACICGTTGAIADLIKHFS
ncbi:hypothetical protein H4R34_003226 [Dimargaris verticillata]|uniref:Amino acid transporter transmembrane domain-containing protein n=1 Tax=Dimargaris verticillata TaxID=2761393 RepID=A0A9W8ECU6_9FUNG|nr:hypothetical protein H4R34_003226 [Dimargaris verticillata]